MTEIQGHKSNEISPHDRIKDEYPSLIIEIAGEPISGERKKSIYCVVKPYADLTSSGPRYSRNCLASTGFFSDL
jgi:hypothetical protein